MPRQKNSQKATNAKNHIIKKVIFFSSKKKHLGQVLPQGERGKKMLNKIKNIQNLSSAEANIFFKIFAKKTQEEQTLIIGWKQKLYNNFKDDYISDLKKNPPSYERIILILAIQLYENNKKSEKIKAYIKNQKLKNRVKKPITLENKFRSIFAEIETYINNGSTYVDITNILKKHHRTMFSGFKLTPSYVRRIILKIKNK